MVQRSQVGQILLELFDYWDDVHEVSNCLVGLFLVSSVTPFRLLSFDLILSGKLALTDNGGVH